MNAFTHFPTRLHWTAQQLADAVPLRLHQLYAFSVADGSAPSRAAANGGRKHRATRQAYAEHPALPSRFGIG